MMKMNEDVAADMNHLRMLARDRGERGHLYTLSRHIAFAPLQVIRTHQPDVFIYVTCLSQRDMAASLSGPRVSE